MVGRDGEGSIPGSSPRARGTLHGDIATSGLSRFIPACAGNTTANTLSIRSKGVHPRVRGEHSMEQIISTPIVRFIPACAGNTQSVSLRCASAWVHPRVRGEHHVTDLAGDTEIGSSPRARGTPERPLVPRLLRRFIPACAGNTWMQATPTPTRPVHPRVRGEHPDGIGYLLSDDGSSPRARGTLGPPEGGRGRDRFIPACAGNTSE